MYLLSGTTPPKARRAGVAPLRLVAKDGSINPAQMQKAIVRAAGDLKKARSAARDQKADPGNNKIVGVMTDAYDLRWRALFQALKSGDPAFRSDKRGTLSRKVLNRAVGLNLTAPQLRSIARSVRAKRPRPPHAARQAIILRELRKRKKLQGLPGSVTTVGMKLQRIGTGQNVRKGAKTFNDVSKTAGKVISVIPPIGPIIGAIIGIVGVIVDEVIKSATTSMEEAQAETLSIAMKSAEKANTARAKAKGAPISPLHVESPTDGGDMVVPGNKNSVFKAIQSSGGGSVEQVRIAKKWSSGRITSTARFMPPAAHKPPPKASSKGSAEGLPMVTFPGKKPTGDKKPTEKKQGSKLPVYAAAGGALLVAGYFLSTRGKR